MVDDKVSHLLQVLKDVNEDELINKLNKIKENNDTHISHLFLEEYFRNKDSCIPVDVYKHEAQCIVNIFPQYSVGYIESMLQTLGCEHNRVIVILRQLLKNEPINNLVTPKEHAYSTYQVLPDSTRTSNILDLFSQPSTSKDYFASSKYYTQLGNPSDIKQETGISNKRKLTESQAPSLKLKIKPLASISNFMGNSELSHPACSKYTAVSETPTFDIEHMGYLEEASGPTSMTENFYLDTKKSSIKLENSAANITKGPIVEKPSQGNFNQVFTDLTGYLLDTITDMQKHQELQPSTTTPAYDYSDMAMSSAKVEDWLKDLVIPETNTNGSVKTSNDWPVTVVPIENNDNYNAERAKTAPNPWISQSSGNDANDLRNRQYLSAKPENTETKSTETPYTWNVDAPVYLPKEIQNQEPLPPSNHSRIKIGKGIHNPRNLITEYDGSDNTLEISSDDDLGDSDNMNEEMDEAPDTVCTSIPTTLDDKLVSKIMEIFPDASSAYVRELCVNRKATTVDIDAVVQIILSNENYPKRARKEPSPDPNLDLQDQVTLLRDILPDADPNYLQYYAELYSNDKEKLKEFMSNALELRNYPTMKEYMRKQQLSAQVKQYTTDFDVEKFLEIIPDPDAYFNDPNKKSSLHQHNKTDILSLHYATRFLKNLYPTIAVKTINYVMTKQKDNLTAAVQEIDDFILSGKNLMKTKRKPIAVDTTIQNIPLLQEIAYLTHRIDIKRYLEEKETKGKFEKELARQQGLLRTCNCCYSDDVMPKNIVTCENGCDFCNECVKTSVEILFGEGKLDYPCLQACGAFFTLQTLKKVMSPKLFSKMAQRKQLEEVKAAGIEELEMCPFCDFATIPAPGDKLFRCLNSECMKESCRQCKEPSHVPLRCDEIEKDDDVKKRTYIENKMTEALIRVCYKCGMKFIKADGCNKMTCSCGAMMCYVCGKPVTDYKHFNGQGGDKHHLCPLYSDTNKLHEEAVVKGAEQAKVEIGVADDPKKLKIDPTADLRQHYNTTNKTTVVHNVHRFPGVGGAPVRVNVVGAPVRVNVGAAPVRVNVGAAPVRVNVGAAPVRVNEAIIAMQQQINANQRRHHHHHRRHGYYRHHHHHDYE